MHKILITLFISIGGLLGAQNLQITYAFSYKRDSLAQQQTSKKTFILQISKNEVKFYPKKFKNFADVMSPGGSVYYSTPMRQVITRERHSDHYTNYQVFNSHYYKIYSEDTIQWKIEKKTKEENGYHLQKATSDFGGRHWIAWFIPSIPLPEGPFKFHGLPGLIYEVYDNQGNFTYTLTAIHKTDKTYDTTPIVETHFGTQPIKITEKQFHQLVLDDYHNPYAQYRAMKEGTWSIGLMGGRVINTIQQLDEYGDEYRAKRRKNNNPVELDKAIHYPKES